MLRDREKIALDIRGEKLDGAPVDFSHGDVEEFKPLPGTQGVLFLAIGSMAARGDKVAIVEPDYFANRKLAEFFECEIVPVSMDYFVNQDKAGRDIQERNQAVHFFKSK